MGKSSTKTTLPPFSASGSLPATLTSGALPTAESTRSRFATGALPTAESTGTRFASALQTAATGTTAALREVLAHGIDFCLINKSILVGIQSIKQPPHLRWHFSFANPPISILVKTHQVKTATALTSRLSPTTKSAKTSSRSYGKTPRSYNRPSTGQSLPAKSTWTAPAFTSGKSSSKFTAPPGASATQCAFIAEKFYNPHLTHALRYFQGGVSILFPANVHVRSTFNQQFDCLNLSLGDSTVERCLTILTIQ